jgi:hypothetical protein
MEREFVPMQIIGSIIRERGVTFAVVRVDGNRVCTQAQADEAIFDLSRLFRGLPVVLMAVSSHHTPTYWGRDDLARFMSRVHPSRVPWRTYTVH